MEILKILYIDDNPSLSLSKYLDKYKIRVVILSIQILNLIRDEG